MYDDHRLESVPHPRNIRRHPPSPDLHLQEGTRPVGGDHLRNTGKSDPRTQDYLFRYVVAVNACFDPPVGVLFLLSHTALSGLEIYISRQWTIGPPALEIWWSCQIPGGPEQVQ